MRAWATVIQRDLQVAAVVGDMIAGRPVVYTTFLAYDEVAHHSGIERHDTLAVLRQVDREIARVQTAIPDAPRPYELVVLSDHGQSQGATFADRWGVTLEDLVRAACEAGSSRRTPAARTRRSPTSAPGSPSSPATTPRRAARSPRHRERGPRAP